MSLSSRAIGVQGVGYRPAILAAQGFLSVEEVVAPVEALRGHQPKRRRGRTRTWEDERRTLTATTALVELRGPLAQRLSRAHEMLARDATLTVSGRRLLVADAKRYVELVGAEIEALIASEDDLALLLVLDEALTDGPEKIALLLALADLEA